MTDPLAKFFDAGKVPARDPVFRIAVMERMAHRKFHFELAKTAGALVLVALCIAIIWPSLLLAFGALTQSTGNVMTILGMIGIVALIGQYATTHSIRLPQLRLSQWRL